MALALRNPSARVEAARPRLRLLVWPGTKPGSSRPVTTISGGSADEDRWRGDYRTLSLAELCRRIAES